MRYLIITIVVLALGSCCKKIDDVCCKDGMYVRFENQTEYEINDIILNQSTLLSNISLNKTEVSTISNIESIIKNIETDEFGITLILSDSSTVFSKLSQSEIQKGCSDIIILSIDPNVAFEDSFDYEIDKIH